MEDALLLVSQLRPPRPLATGGVSEDALLLPPPFCCRVHAAATTHLQHSVCCSLQFAALQLYPNPVTNVETIGALQAVCRSLVAAVLMLQTLVTVVSTAAHASAGPEGWVSPCGGTWLLDAKGLVPPHTGSLVAGPHGGRPPAGVSGVATPPAGHWWGFGVRPPSPTAFLLWRWGCSLHTAGRLLRPACSTHRTAACSLLHTAATPSPITNPGTMGALQPKGSSPVAMMFMLPSVPRSLQLYPSPVTNLGTIVEHRGRISSYIYQLKLDHFAWFDQFPLSDIIGYHVVRSAMPIHWEGAEHELFGLERLPMGATQSCGVANTTTWPLMEPIIRMEGVFVTSMVDNVTICSNDLDRFVEAVQSYLARATACSADLNGLRSRVTRYPYPPLRQISCAWAYSLAPSLRPSWARNMSATWCRTSRAKWPSWRPPLPGCVRCARTPGSW